MSTDEDLEFRVCQSQPRLERRQSFDDGPGSPQNQGPGQDEGLELLVGQFESFLEGIEYFLVIET